jgi:UDP-3-O-[3-hydroxymyristoyl] glucosamine N-acyltransferase
MTTNFVIKPSTSATKRKQTKMFREVLQQMKFDLALDLTRLGQRFLGLPLTRRSVKYLTADIIKPKVSNYATLDPSAVVSGTVKIQDYSVVGPRAVLRGDMSAVYVSKNVKIGG